MNSNLNEVLDTWMVGLHTEKYEEAKVLRLATLLFCVTLSKNKTVDVSELGEGTTVIDVTVAAKSDIDTPAGFTARNLVEGVFEEYSATHKQRVSIPRKFNITYHLGGMSTLQRLLERKFYCEIHTTLNGNKVAIEIYSKPLKRFMIFEFS